MVNLYCFFYDQILDRNRQSPRFRWWASLLNDEVKQLRLISKWKYFQNNFQYLVGLDIEI